MSRPRLLDLFCGGGGCSVGYHRAGFEVVGVDIMPQSNFPFEFIQLDALWALDVLIGGGSICPSDTTRYWLKDFAAIHASPPCKPFTMAQKIHGRQHPDLLAPTRCLLMETGKPWVIENVPGAPMRADVVLCGSQFGEPRLKRHRLFEFSNPPAFLMMPPCSHGKQIISVFGHGGHVYHGVEEWREVMGIDWMTRDELAQAIPPTYTEWIGARLLEAL